MSARNQLAVVYYGRAPDGWKLPEGAAAPGIYVVRDDGKKEVALAGPFAGFRAAERALTLFGRTGSFGGTTQVELKRTAPAVTTTTTIEVAP